MSYLFLLSMILCGCSIDSAFDNTQGTAVWITAFITAIACAVLMGKGQGDDN